VAILQKENTFNHEEAEKMKNKAGKTARSKISDLT